MIFIQWWCSFWAENTFKRTENGDEKMIKMKRKDELKIEKIRDEKWDEKKN